MADLFQAEPAGGRNIFYPIKWPQVAQSGTPDWVNLIFSILRGDTSGPSQLELILVSIEM